MMVVADYNNVDGDYNIEISKMCRLNSVCRAYKQTVCGNCNIAEK